MRNIFIALIALAALLLSGCTQGNGSEACAQIVTPAVSPDGNCTAFATPCDVPSGFTIVASCEPYAPNQPVEETQQPEQEIDLCKNIKCEDTCTGTSFYGDGRCSEGQCVYSVKQENSDKCGYIEPQPTQGNWAFDANLLLCEYISPPNEYDFIYKIRNLSDKALPYQSTIWLMVPDFNGYAQQRTIQGNYGPNRILWEENVTSYLGQNFRGGQEWKIRNLDSNKSLDFQLIFCTPENSTKEKCTAESGVVIASGNTNTACRITGQA